MDKYTLDPPQGSIREGEIVEPAHTEPGKLDKVEPTQARPLKPLPTDGEGE